MLKVKIFIVLLREFFNIPVLKGKEIIFMSHITGSTLSMGVEFVPSSRVGSSGKKMPTLYSFFRAT